MPTSTALQPHSLLGFTAHPGNKDAYLSHVARAVKDAEATTVLAHNLHSLHLYYRSEPLRRSYEGTVNMVDGMPVIWLLKLAGHKVNSGERLTYVDFIWPLLEQAQRKQWRVCHIGQKDAVQQRAMAEISRRLPALQLHAIHGYFDHSPHSADSLAVLDEVNQFAPQLLLVGLGSPVQEQWIAQHRALIQAPAVLSCGACMEYVAGEVGTPPRWMGRTGLEWSFRLMENPRRFASRYFVEPWGLLYSLLRFAISERH